MELEINVDEVIMYRLLQPIKTVCERHKECSEECPFWNTFTVCRAGDPTSDIPEQPADWEVKRPAPRILRR